MTDRPSLPGRPSPSGRLPIRSFRKSGTVPAPSPTALPNAPTPAAPPPPPPSKNRSGRIPQPVPHDSPIDHDIACGVLAGIFDSGPHTVTQDLLTVVNPADHSQKVYRNWIQPNDVVGALTRMFLAARQSLNETPQSPLPPPPQTLGGRPTLGSRPMLGGRLTPSTVPVPVAAPPLGQKTQQQLARDEAVARNQELKRQLYDVLRFRDAIDRAQKKGFRVLFVPPDTQSGVFKRSIK